MRKASAKAESSSTEQVQYHVQRLGECCRAALKRLCESRSFKPECSKRAHRPSVGFTHTFRDMTSDPSAQLHELEQMLDENQRAAHLLQENQRVIAGLQRQNGQLLKRLSATNQAKSPSRIVRVHNTVPSFPGIHNLCRRGRTSPFTPRHARTSLLRLSPASTNVTSPLRHWMKTSATILRHSEHAAMRYYGRRRV